MIRPPKLSFWYYILFSFIVLLGLFLRHYNYRTIPRTGATFDEFAWTWQGINLLQKGVPISWSPHPQYTHRQHLVYEGAAFWIVRPYLEHPPLFGLIAGGYALSHGVKDMYGVTVAKIRPLSLYMGIISLVLVMIFATMLYGQFIGILSGALYATIPTIVIGSRLVQNENFLIPMWLVSLICIYRYIQTDKKLFYWIAVIVSALLSLAKVPWFITTISLAMLLSYKGKWKDAFLAVGVSLVFFSAFIFYGFYYDKELFINLWRLQLARYDIHFQGIFALFTNPLLADRMYIDGWIYTGFISVLFLSRNIKKHIFVLLPFFAYFVIYIFAIPNEPGHGWYRYPFLPFLTIATAVFIREEIKEVTLASLINFLLIGLALLGLTWETQFGFSFGVYRFFILALCGSMLIPLWFKKYSKVLPYCVMAWFLFFLTLNIWSVLTYIE